MSVRWQTLLWFAQRISGAVLALAVIVHIATVVYAVRGGLNAAEIIARVDGNVAWFGFYLLFVAAAAVHAPLGVRTILAEATPLRGSLPGLLAALFGIALAVLGWRAAFSLFAYGGG
ncbi:MAG: succinate dehydrogenase [Acidiferrobacterales bacterium]